MERLTVPIFTGKGDPLECCKERGLTLLEHSMNFLPCRRSSIIIWARYLISGENVMVTHNNAYLAQY